MKLFIVAVPLFAADMSVDAYRLVYQKGNFFFGSDNRYTLIDGAMNSPGLDLINTVGVEPFTGGKKIFVSITQFHLLSSAPVKCSVDPKQLVCVLGSDVKPEDAYIDKARELKDMGYPIALKSVEYLEENLPFFDMADYLLINTGKPKEFLNINIIKREYPNIRIVYTNVNDSATFDKVKGSKSALFEGKFYSQPMKMGEKPIAPLKVNALRLINIAADEDFDLEEISKIIERDASLSISLLRFINSPAIGLSVKVASIAQAVALLGQKEMRKWITMTVSVSLGADRPDEITRMSLVRAKFAENLATCFELGYEAPSLFLMGLFSPLDIILEMPMEKAVEQVALSDKVKNALLGKPGEFNDILSIIKAYEQGDWPVVSRIMISGGSNVELVSGAFIDALVWYRDLLSLIE